MTAHCKPVEATTSEMVERVALGIANARRARQGIGACLWEHLTDEGKAEHIAYAQVAIGTMREPTDKMLAEGAYGSGEDSEGVARGAWYAMIDEALK